MDTAKSQTERAIDRANAKRDKLDDQGMRYLLADKRGRWFLMRLYEQCHMLDTTFTAEDHTNRMLIHEGERRVALRIQRNIAQSEDTLDAMETARREYYAFWRNEQAVIDAIKEKEQEHEPLGI